MQERKSSGFERGARFFRITHDSMELFNHYRANVKLMNEKYFSLTELDGMIPFERAVYIDLMNNEKKQGS
jgi:hypothetical protein